MKPVPGFVSGAYLEPSVPGIAQRSVNLYLEGAADGRQALIGTPGLALVYALPDGPVRGAGTMNKRTFIVAADTLYETTSGTPVARGSLASGVGRVAVANNDTTLLIVDGVGGYTFSDAGGFKQIDDPDFPNGVTQCAWEGQYFIVGVDGSKQFFVSELASASSWNGLDFASAENKPEVLKALIVLHDRLFLFAVTGMEQWGNTGGGTFAFERDNGSSSEVGIEAPASLASMNNGLYWLGRDKEGSCQVFALQGGTPSRISTHSLERQLQSVDCSDAYAFTYQQQGHSFYCLTVPALEWTFVYDAATQKWHDRAYWTGEAFTRWRAACHVFNGKHLVGDYETGNVYALDLDVFTDNGQPIRRVRPIPAIAPYARMTFNRFGVDAEMGVAASGLSPAMTMRFSNDNGRSWGPERIKSLGAIGDTGARAVFHRCGSMKEGGKRVFEIVVSDPVKVAFYGAYMDATVDA